ncbi:hypothetical protein E2C01_034794 [Portunus trituberculatus]|uniref:Uncharacterized protein n=1 Tax=Portunus trituberculatus TaxID=210409 RepID=A0A5B7F6M7_PORTR|nr:hypothetical protein [Portunus trituberculatus]
MSAADLCTRGSLAHHSHRGVHFTPGSGSGGRTGTLAGQTVFITRRRSRQLLALEMHGGGQKHVISTSTLRLRGSLHQKAQRPLTTRRRRYMAHFSICRQSLQPRESFTLSRTTSCYPSLRQEGPWEST